jgi:hypothetical protein
LSILASLDACRVTLCCVVCAILRSGGQFNTRCYARVFLGTVDIDDDLQFVPEPVPAVGRWWVPPCARVAEGQRHHSLHLAPTVACRCDWSSTQKSRFSSQCSKLIFINCVPRALAATTSQPRARLSTAGACSDDQTGTVMKASRPEGSKPHFWRGITLGEEGLHGAGQPPPWHALTTQALEDEGARCVRGAEKARGEKGSRDPRLRELKRNSEDERTEGRGGERREQKEEKEKKGWRWQGGRASKDEKRRLWLPA